MLETSNSPLAVASISCGLLVAMATAVAGQGGVSGAEWPTYGADLANTRYSVLDQIDGSNFDDLEIAWRFKTDNLGPRPEFNFQSTPLMVEGVLYSTAGARRSVVALTSCVTSSILSVQVNSRLCM